MGKREVSFDMVNIGGNELNFFFLNIYTLFRYPHLELISEAEFFGLFKASLAVNQSISWRTAGRISENSTEQLRQFTDIVLERDYTKTGDLLLNDVKVESLDFLPSLFVFVVFWIVRILTFFLTVLTFSFAASENSSIPPSGSLRPSLGPAGR